MKKIVIRVDPERRQWWKETMISLLPGYEVYLWDEDEFDKNDIDYAIVWAPPSGMLAALPKLQAIFSVGAGVSHITDDPTFPRHVPIIRTTGPALRQRMCEYIAMHVLRIHRRLPEIERAARAGEWKQFVEPVASNVRVGIMGAGNLGAAASNTLIALGYDVRTLSRRGDPVSGLTIYPRTAISEFLHGINILICMLPGTPETDDIISADSIGKLPTGAWIINVGRGTLVNDDDLLAALDRDHLGGAVLDVFRREPLPSDHAFWHHPKILITSHTASAIEPAVGGEIIANNLLSFVAGKKLSDLVDIDQGY
jgi:glyoxylate/hydroxypyruvate reductase A